MRYYANGGLKTRMDARGAGTYNSSVDKFGRVLTREYSAVDGVTRTMYYCYDGRVLDGAGVCALIARSDYPVGAMTHAVSKKTVGSTTSTVSETQYTSIDALGRVRELKQTTEGLSEKGVKYEYAVDGTLAKVQYPSGNWVSYEVDRGNRVKMVRKGETGDSYYLQNALYSPHGGLASATVGLNAANRWTEAWGYNSRLQARKLRVRKGTAKVLGLDWIYTENATYDTGKDEYEETETNNNGNLRKEKLAHDVGTPLSVERSYRFDTANRVVSYADTGMVVAHAYGFDGFGNVWQTAGTPALRANSSSWYVQTGGKVNNRLANTSYDEAGHQTQLSLVAGTVAKYDGEGRVWRVEVGGSAVSESEYDAEGRRVKRLANGVTTWLVYGSDGKLLAEYGGTPQPVGTQYVVQDYLGSTRLVLDVVGGVVERLDYAPFGGKITRAGASGYGTGGGNGKPLFTGKFRDEETGAGTETGLDYFEARYLWGALGRFTSPDKPLLDQHPEDPQSWNLYSYVRNNPLRFIDPNGQELRVSQGWDQAEQDLCRTLGTSDCADRISYNQKTQVVSVNLQGIDLSKNAGAKLLGDLTGSKNVYDLSYGSTVNTQGGLINVNFIENLDINPDWRYGRGKQATDLPAVGIANQIAFNWDNVTPASTNLLRPADRYSVVFHELAEAFAKIDLGMPYMVRGQIRQGAHYDAMDREKVLRRERPELFMYNYGSGPGTNYPLHRRLRRIP